MSLRKCVNISGYEQLLWNDSDRFLTVGQIYLAQAYMGQYTSNRDVRVYIHPQSKLLTQTCMDTSNVQCRWVWFKWRYLTSHHWTNYLVLYACNNYMIFCIICAWLDGYVPVESLDDIHVNHNIWCRSDVSKFWMRKIFTTWFMNWHFMNWQLYVKHGN